VKEGLFTKDHRSKKNSYAPHVHAEIILFVA
jgi:hypothetical protein